MFIFQDEHCGAGMSVGGNIHGGVAGRPVPAQHILQHRDAPCSLESNSLQRRAPCCCPMRRYCSFKMLSVSTKGTQFHMTLALLFFYLHKSVDELIWLFVSRKYKIQNYQNGCAYLTSHRACYVDNDNPRKYSVAVDLKDIDRHDFYVGWPKPHVSPPL